MDSGSEGLASKCIHTGSFATILPRLGFKEDQYPEAENYARKSISIPLYPGLKEQDQKRVVEALTTLLGQ